MMGARLTPPRGVITNGLCCADRTHAADHDKHAEGDRVCDVDMSSKRWVS